MDKIKPGDGILNSLSSSTAIYPNVLTQKMFDDAITSMSTKDYHRAFVLYTNPSDRMKTLKVDKNIIKSFVFYEELDIGIFHDIMDLFKNRPMYVTINCTPSFAHLFHNFMYDFSGVTL